MNLGYLIVAVVAVSVTLFALQNTDQTAVRFAFWQLEAVPIAALVLGCFGAGLLIAAVPLWIKLTIWRGRARSLEARVATLEAAVHEADRQRLRMPPPGRPGTSEHAGP